MSRQLDRSRLGPQSAARSPPSGRLAATATLSCPRSSRRPSPNAGTKCSGRKGTWHLHSLLLAPHRPQSKREHGPVPATLHLHSGSITNDTVLLTLKCSPKSTGFFQVVSVVPSRRPPAPRPGLSPQGLENTPGARWHAQEHSAQLLLGHQEHTFTSRARTRPPLPAHALAPGCSVETGAWDPEGAQLDDPCIYLHSTQTTAGVHRQNMVFQTLHPFH